MSKNVLVTAPGVSPVSVAEFKIYARIDFDDEDTFIARVIDAAKNAVEAITNRKIISQVWRADYDHFPFYFQLPFAPVKSVASITYYDTDNVQQTLATANYDVDLSKLLAEVHQAYSYTWPCTYPRKNAVSLTYTVGESKDNVDGDLQIALYAIALQMFEDRKTDIDLDFARRILINKTIKSFVE